MSQVFFISDLHLDHKNVINFSRDYRVGQTIEEHNEWLVSQWNSVVKKGDRTYVLGDVVFSKEALSYLPRMNGIKFLVRGNHDTLSTETYLQYFNQVYGLYTKYGYWMSHAPIHSSELREKKNIHGHVHHRSLPDENYINVSVEVLNGIPISLDEIRNNKPLKV